MGKNKLKVEVISPNFPHKDNIQYIKLLDESRIFGISEQMDVDKMKDSLAPDKYTLYEYTVDVDDSRYDMEFNNIEIENGIYDIGYKSLVKLNNISEFTHNIDINKLIKQNKKDLIEIKIHPKYKLDRKLLIRDGQEIKSIHYDVFMCMVGTLFILLNNENVVFYNIRYKYTPNNERYVIAIFKPIKKELHTKGILHSRVIPYIEFSGVKDKL